MSVYDDDAARAAFHKWHKNHHGKIDRASAEYTARWEVWSYLWPILSRRTKRLNRINQKMREGINNDRD